MAFPSGALVPDHYFDKSAKWIEWIKFCEQDEPGYWENSGYSNFVDPWKGTDFKRKIDET